MRKFLLIFSFLLIGSAALAQSESKAVLYNRANEMYAKERFEEAIQLYEKILSDGFTNYKVEYNLANAYLKTNPPSLAKAILHYERALKLAPRDEEIRYNLEYARSLIRGKLPEPNKSWVQRKWSELILNIAPQEAMSVLSAFYFISLLSLIFYLIFEGEKIKKTLRTVAIASAVFFVLSLPIAYSSLKNSSQEKGVVLEDELPARSGPGEENKELFKVYEGVTFKKIETRNGWLLVELPNGLRGWLPAQKVEKI